MVTEQHRSVGADEGVSAYGGAGAREGTGPSRPTARGRAVITGGAVQRFLATPDQVGAARKFVAQELGEDHPCADDAVVSLSEVATNAVAHSYSARAGHDGDVGAFTVTLTYGEAWARVEVRDGGGPTRPYANAQGPEAVDACEALPTCGWGLAIVGEIAADWGYVPEPDGTTVWFEVAAGDSPRAAGATSPLA